VVADVLNDSFTSSDALNESFKAFGPRPPRVPDLAVGLPGTGLFQDRDCAGLQYKERVRAAATL
jgi:hypothetical protein